MKIELTRLKNRKIYSKEAESFSFNTSLPECQCHRMLPTLQKIDARTKKIFNYLELVTTAANNATLLFTSVF